MPDRTDVFAVLDSEALSALAHPHERGTSAQRAHVVLHAIARLGGYAIIPAPVLAEVSRGRRAAGVARIVQRHEVVSTDRRIAERAGQLLERCRLGSEHAVDAFVAATAIELGRAVILTGDVRDLRRLTGAAPGVIVRSLVDA